MAYKKYGFESLELAGITFDCYVQNTRYGFRHVCTACTGDYPHASCAYYNRTWERFKFESVIRKTAEKLPQEDRDRVRAAIEDHAEEGRRRAEASAESFAAEFDKLPESMKEHIRALPPIDTVEELEARTSIVKMYNIITGE